MHVAIMMVSYKPDIGSVACCLHHWQQEALQLAAFTACLMFKYLHAIEQQFASTQSEGVQTEAQFYMKLVVYYVCNLCL
jgi:hypothetical protein